MSSAHDPRTLAGLLAYLVRRPWQRNPLLALAAFTALASVAHWAGLLTWIERIVSDVTLVLLPGQPPGHVVTIAIDDAQYDDEFAGRSPLDAKGPEGRGVLEALVVRIATARPRVIVIDIDTAHPTFADLGAKVAGQLPAGANAPALIWFRDWDSREGRSHARGFLGEPNENLDCHGSPACGIGSFVVDSDGMIRRYIRELRTAPTGGVAYPSLGWRAAQAYCADDHTAACDRINKTASDAERLAEDPLLVFPRSPLVGMIGKRGLLGGSAQPSAILARDLAVSDWWQPYVRDRIVVLGGTYEAGRDVHRTALGEVPGVALWAASIENELLGPVADYHRSTLIIADLIVGFALLALLWMRPSLQPGRLPNVLVNGCVVAVLWMAAYWLVNDYGLLVGFVPIAVGLWLHQCFDIVAEGRQHERELAACRAELATRRREEAKF